MIFQIWLGPGLDGYENMVGYDFGRVTKQYNLLAIKTL